MRNDTKIGIDFKDAPPERDLPDEVESSNLMLVLPGTEGQGLERHVINSFGELVEQLNTTTRATIRSVRGAELGATACELPQVDVELQAGAESPSNAEQDLIERGVVWKSRQTNAPEGIPEIESRVLLASRVEQSALETILQFYHEMAGQAQAQELLDPERRQSIAAELRARAEQIEDLCRRHAPNNTRNEDH